MQVSCDSAVNYVSTRVGASQDGRAWYRVTITDQTGDVINMYTDANVYGKLSGCKIGDKLQLICDVHPGKSGLSIRAIDVVIGN